MSDAKHTPGPWQDDIIRDLRVLLAGFKDDPGTPDLDDEQPIYLAVTLGDWRKARRSLAKAENRA